MLCDYFSLNQVFILCLRWGGKLYKKVYVTVVTVIALLHIHSIMIVNKSIPRLSAVEIGQTLQTTKTSVEMIHPIYRLPVLNNEKIKPVGDNREWSLERSANSSVVTNRLPRIANKPLKGIFKPCQAKRGLIYSSFRNDKKKIPYEISCDTYIYARLTIKVTSTTLLHYSSR